MPRTQQLIDLKQKPDPSTIIPYNDIVSFENLKPETIQTKSLCENPNPTSESVISMINGSRGTKKLYVNINTTNCTQDGCSWQTAFKDLQSALEAARSNTDVSKILIAAGVYKPTQTYSPLDETNTPVTAGAFSLPEYNPGKNNDYQTINYTNDPTLYNRKLKTFHLIDGVDLEGGFVISHKGCVKNCCGETILDGNLGTEEEPDYVWHVMIAGNDVLGTGISCDLINLTIKNADAMEAPFYPEEPSIESNTTPIYSHDHGGGLLAVAKSFINLTDVKFQNCRAIAGGGLYYDDGGIFNVNYCCFENNFAYDGSAIAVRSGGRSEFQPLNNRLSYLNTYKSKYYDNESVNGTIFGYDNYFEGIFNKPKPKSAHLKIDKCYFNNKASSFDIGGYACYAIEVYDSKMYTTLDYEVQILCALVGFNRIVGNKFYGPENKTNNQNIAIYIGMTNGENYNLISKNKFKNYKTLYTHGAVTIVNFFSPNPIRVELKDNCFKNNYIEDGGTVVLYNVNVLNQDWACSNKFIYNSTHERPDILGIEPVYLPRTCKKCLEKISVVIT